MTATKGRKPIVDQAAVIATCQRLRQAEAAMIEVARPLVAREQSERRQAIKRLERLEKLAAEKQDLEAAREAAELAEHHRAVCASKALCGNGGNARRFLRQMAFWTDEALDHPRLWAVVESLAERLQAVKTRISGRRVLDIIEKAWPDAVLSVMEMGQKWRRRFAVTARKEGS